MINCESCKKELNRHIFCDDACRSKFYYTKRVGKEPKGTKKEYNYTNSVEDGRKADSLENNPYFREYKEPERIPFNWRDSKGQCQHKLKTCDFCFK